MTTTLATPVTADEEPWHPGVMRSEPLEEAVDHLSALAAELDSTGSRVLLSRPGLPDLVLMPAHELLSLEETLFWCGVEIRRARAGAAPADEPGPTMTADEARAEFTPRPTHRDG